MCAGTGLTPAHICTGTGLTRAAQFMGALAEWDAAESRLRDVLDKSGRTWQSAKPSPPDSRRVRAAFAPRSRRVSVQRAAATRRLSGARRVRRGSAVRDRRGGHQGGCAVHTRATGDAAATQRRRSGDASHLRGAALACPRALPLPAPRSARSTRATARSTGRRLTCTSRTRPSTRAAVPLPPSEARVADDEADGRR